MWIADDARQIGPDVKLHYALAKMKFPATGNGVSSIFL
jgi:hypothetical protein